MNRAVEVVRAGALTTVQDLGRPGYAHLGVGRSGALDRAAHRLANRLVGNGPGAATLETTLTGVAVRVSAPTVAAVCGAAAPVSVDGHAAAWGEPVHLSPGAVLEVGPATIGVRCYVALAGGVAPAPVLGSRSTDLLSGLGPPALRDGDVLPLGEPQGPENWGAGCPAGALGSALELPVLPGPRGSLFDPAAWRLLTSAGYTVAPASNRIGLRLDGPALPRRGPDTIASEGAVLGAVQVPADGRPIVFLADHPPTGGYPVIGVVPGGALDLAAQAAPGDPVRFRPAA